MLYPNAVKHILFRNGERLFNSGRPFGAPNKIVLHITEGSTAAGAISWVESRENPTKASFHFVIDRDGTITQGVDTNDCAWHASQCNSRSIGIEHVALSAKGAAALHVQPLMATDAQYAASATLVAWLCGQYGIPCDRQHIRTHNEASPADGHVECCTGALDPDKVAAMAASFMASPDQA